MADSSHEQFWSELRRRGFLGPTDPVPLNGGNLDRRSEQDRWLYRATLPDGRLAKLTVGRNLTDLSAHARLWREKCPALACAPVFSLRLGEYDLLAEEYFVGDSLASLVTSRTLPVASLHRAMQEICSTLHNTRRPSTDAARREEWQHWHADLCALPLWDARDRAFLGERLLPCLGDHLRQGPAVLQLIHGDLTDANILLSAAGRPCLIDAEFSGETHFAAIEAARFQALSTSAAAQPGLFAALLPPASPAEQIHFWLTQIQREYRNNTAAYVSRWLPHRLGLIRQLTSELEPALADCPWPPTTETARVSEETAQLFETTDAGWTETRSRRIRYHRGSTQTLFFPLNSPHGPWRLDPAASAATTVISTVTFYSADNSPVATYRHRALAQCLTLPLGDTTLEVVTEGLRMASKQGDPQLAITPPPPPEATAGWLEIELLTRFPDADSASALRHHLEHAHWLAVPAPAAVRLAGWCLSPDESPLVAIKATIAGTEVASVAPANRSDVAQAFPAITHAAHSGFELDLPDVATTDDIELSAISASGLAQVFLTLSAGNLPQRGPVLGDYPAWIRRHDPARPAALSAASPALGLSVLLPVYNPPENFFRECVESVLAQHHANWELCIVDDGSTATWIEPYLTELGRRDTRIRYQRRPQNGGISRATNDALAIATNPFVVFLDHDDLLHPAALSEFVRRLDQEPTLDAIYSDEDKISASGEPITPFLKPAFSPELLRGVMYVGHLLCVRRSVALAAGGFDPNFDGVQDYEFFLRVAETTSRIAHLPRILYHWRQSPASSALHGNVKGDMDARQLAAVEAHLSRTGSSRQAMALGGHRVRLLATQPPKPIALLLAWPPGTITDGVAWTALTSPHVSLYALLKTPLGSATTSVSRLTHDELSSALRALAGESRFAAIVVLTSPPLDVSANWIDELASLASLPDSGLVAPLLLSREGQVLESGWTFSPQGAHPVMRGFAADGDGYNGSLLCSREVAAVSPLCFTATPAVLNRLVEPTSLADWFRQCRALITPPTYFHRVCASARIRLPLSWRTAGDITLSPRGLDPFFNRHFNARRADYSLATPPLPIDAEADLHWHFDLAPPPTAIDGCLEIRGWCFRSFYPSVTLRLTVGDLTWASSCDQPRPDVAASYPQLDGRGCGFSLRVKLPSGYHPISIEVIEEQKSPIPLSKTTITVPRTADLRRAVAQSPERRLAFQFLAGPSHPPRRLVAPSLPTPRLHARDWPKLVVVTPSFQQAPYLEETIRSVLDQPQVQCDYLVQDGGSTDGSVEIISRYAAKLASAASARDRGQADAIQRAFAKTTGAPGDVMAWLNSDDFYLPGTLAYVADYFARHPDIDVVYGDRILVDDQSREIGRWRLPAHDEEVLRLNDFVPQETMFWRRRIWDKVGGLDASFRFAMDWDLLLRFQAAGARIAHLPHCLACFRIHPAQKTSAQMASVGQQEIDSLRRRTFGRVITPGEIERHPQLIRYLRRSAWIEFLWRRLHIRHG